MEIYLNCKTRGALGMRLVAVVNLKNENSKRRLTEGGALWLVGREGLRKEVLARRKDNCL